jgi:hypothetical protein
MTAVRTCLLTAACVLWTPAPRADEPRLDRAKIRADLEKSRADAERRSREIRERVEKAQRETRARLNLPAEGTDPARPSTPSGASPAPTRSSPSRFQPCPLAYRPVRGRDYAFRVEMTATPDPTEWKGDVYLKGIFADSGGGPAEMYCIGRLEARRWVEAKQEWYPSPAEDVVFPELIRFNPNAVLNTETTGMFDDHTLPMQMSAILPVERLIFPDLPRFAGDPDDSRSDTTFYIRTESSSPILLGPQLTELKGERRRLVRVDNETSSSPRAVNLEGFFCADKGMGMKFQQSAAFDVAGGMVAGSTLDFTLQWEREFRMRVVVSRLAGAELAAAKQAALERMPVARWPTCVLRTPAAHDDYEIGLVHSASEFRPGDPVSVAVSIDDRNVHGSRDYAATVAGIVDDRHIRARLEGSGELVDVGIGSVHRKKR